MMLKKSHMLVIVLLLLGLFLLVFDKVNFTGQVITGNTFTIGTETVDLNFIDAFVFYINEQRYVLVVTVVQEDSVSVRITPGSLDATATLEGTEILDVDGNGLDDFSIELITINKLGGTFKFTILEEKEDGTIIISDSEKEVEELEETDGESEEIEEIGDVAEEIDVYYGGTEEKEQYPPNRNTIYISGALFLVVLVILVMRLKKPKKTVEIGKF